MPRLPEILGNEPAPARPGRSGNDRKRRVMRTVTNRLVNPLVRRAIEVAPFNTGWALLETTGRRSGAPRRVPVGDGLRGDTFWIVTEHGWGASYVRNIEADPRVRVKAHGRWRAGTARLLPDDDPYARLRWLGRPLNDTLLLVVGTQQLTVRIDLDPE
jgi:deazaflavin-dependent oxidoreductase (nitroreductase family)